jgi:regulator of protease activity HflC (stomatin/prohibitin superfamily)
MGWIQPLIDLLAFIWPLRRVEQWEVGGRYWWGRWVKTVGPGVYFVIPWFGEVRAVTTAEVILGTGRLDLAIKDNTVLSYAATATLKIVDPYLALNAVHEYQETAQEALMAVLSGVLGDESLESFEPKKRTWLLKRVETAVREKLGRYGMEVLEVNFISLIPNARIHRLVMDQMSPISF